MSKLNWKTSGICPYLIFNDFYSIEKGKLYSIKDLKRDRFVGYSDSLDGAKILAEGHYENTDPKIISSLEINTYSDIELGGKKYRLRHEVSYGDNYYYLDEIVYKEMDGK